MPQFRTLSNEEVEARRKRQVNTAYLEPYMEYLRTLNPGDYGEITLQPGDQRRVVKRRTTVAANELGMAIKWRRARDENKLLFEVIPVAL